MTPWIILAVMAAFAAGLLSAILLRRIDVQWVDATTTNVKVPRNQPKEPASEHAGISDDRSQADTQASPALHRIRSRSR